jgi:hypothetical protein
MFWLMFEEGEHRGTPEVKVGARTHVKNTLILFRAFVPRDFYSFGLQVN